MAARRPNNEKNRRASILKCPTRGVKSGEKAFGGLLESKWKKSLKKKRVKQRRNKGDEA
jgi:hypothetical protein